jgi:hypothetical protein
MNGLRPDLFVATTATLLREPGCEGMALPISEVKTRAAPSVHSQREHPTARHPTIRDTVR